MLQPRALPFSSCTNTVAEDRLYPLDLPHILFLPLLHLLHLLLMSIPALLSSTSISLPPLIDRTHYLSTGVFELVVQVLKQGQVVLQLTGKSVVKKEETAAVGGDTRWILRVGGVQQGRGRGWGGQLVVGGGRGCGWVIEMRGSDGCGVGERGQSWVAGG